MRGPGLHGDRRRTAIAGIVGAVMLASLAGACLASSRATEPVVGNGPALPPPISAGPPAAGQRLPRSFTVVATGDIRPSPRVVRQAGRDGGGRLDYRGMLAPLVPFISEADLAICHLDRPLAPAPRRHRGAGAAPPGPALALAELGYDACAVASDHALDQGAAGVARTLRGLDAAGLWHAGAARSAAEAAAPTMMNVRGVRVALLSATGGVAERQPLRAAPWLVDRIDPGRILAAARRARRAGARAVIVSLHWGEAAGPAASPGQIALARRLLGSPDIDLVVGQGGAVVQPFGRATNGKFVAYGMGHLLAAPARRPAATEPTPAAGIVTRFTFARGAGGGWKVTRAEFIPTFIDTGPPLRVVEVTEALADPGLPAARRRVLQDVLRRTMRTVYSRGAAPVLAR
ncbi:MAG TPA: CapA family protein [Streptosporangiaceae bacterium]